MIPMLLPQMILLNESGAPHYSSAEVRSFLENAGPYAMINPVNHGCANDSTCQGSNSGCANAGCE